MSTLFKICILFLNVSWKISRLTFKVVAVQWICATFLVYDKRIYELCMYVYTVIPWCRDNVGPGIKSGDSEIFRKIQTGPEVHPASFTMTTGYLTRLKRPGHDSHNTSRSSAEVANRLELP